MNPHFFIGGAQKAAKIALLHFFAARNMVDIPTWFSTSGLPEQGANKIPLLRQ
jgi:hypothetical protein